MAQFSLHDMFDQYAEEQFDDLFDAGDFQRKSNRRMPEKHLSTPITYGFYKRVFEDYEKSLAFKPLSPLSSTKKKYTRTYLEQRFNTYLLTKVTTDARYRAKKYCERARRLVKLYASTRSGRLPKLLDPTQYPELFNVDASIDNTVAKDFDSAKSTYHLKQEAILDYLKTCESFPEPITEAIKVTENLSDLTIRWFSNYKVWSNTVDWVRAKAVGSQSEITEEFIVTENIKLKRNQSTLVLRYGSRNRFVTFEQLQMIQDVCQMRANVFMCLDLKLHNGTSELSGLVQRLIQWQENCLLRYGNDGYELVKAPEAIYKAKMTSLSQGDIFVITSLSRTFEKIREKERKISQETPITDELELVCEDTLYLEDCAELFGLIKLSGHPLVNAEDSARSVRVEAQPDPLYTIAAVRRMVRHLMHIILSNFIKTNQDWPPFKQPPKPDTILGDLYKRRVMSLSFDDYNLTDLDDVKFGQFERFDFSNDYLQFLDDKAICPGASELPKFWFGGAKQETRRLLLSVLQGEGLNMKELTMKYARGEFSLDELVVELTQKEREMKIAARCFCKLPLTVRCFFTLTEYNLGEGIMKKYIPQQSMTMSDAETKTRLYQQSRRTADPDYNGVVVEVDFSRWNLRWRDEIVYPVARMLEDIYGFPGVFSQAHRFFKSSTIVMTEPDMVPEGADENKPIHEWPESSLLWRNHQGGFEGIQQKLWTICTVGMIHNALMDSSCRFLLTGQGDNQVLTLSFPKDDNIQNRLRTFLCRLETEARLLNHVVKPEECIDSKSVLTYSKDIYVRGVNYQYSLKFASRLMTVADGDIPSLSAEISNSCATAVAVANTLPFPFKALVLQDFNVIRNLRNSIDVHSSNNHRAIVRSLLRKKRREELAFFLSLPGSLGGLPILSWGRYFMRGEVDELSWDIASTIRLIPYIPKLGGDLSLLLRGSYSPKRPDLTQLISDPKSISLIRPKDNRRLVKDHIKERLPAYTTNPHFRQILNIAVGSSSESLLQDLTKMRPLYPNIAKDIFEASLAGVRESLFDRFTMTRTVATLLGDYSFLYEIRVSSEALVQSVATRYLKAKTFRNNRHRPSSTYDIAERLRSFWKVEGGQLVQSTICPLALELSNDIVSRPCISASVRADMRSIMSKVGRFPPNFGTKTRQKRTSHGVKIHESSGTIIDLKKLVLISSELQATGPLREIIDEIIRTRSPWSLDQLEPIFPSVYGGTAAHRHDSMQHQFFGILGNCTPPTHISFSTDNSGELVGGEDDYPVVFQEFFLFLTNLFQMISLVTDQDVYSLAVILPDKVPILPNEQVEINSQLSLRQWPDVNNNPLAFADTIDLQFVTVRPPEDIVPNAELPLAPLPLLLSFLLSTSKVKHGIVEDIANNVIAVKEFLDIAEFNGVAPSVFLDAICKFAVIESLYHLSREIAPNVDLLVKRTLQRLLLEYSGPAARLFLSIRGPREVYVKNVGAAAHPGEKGAIAYSRKLYHKMLTKSEELLQDLSWITSTRFYIFSDSSSSGTSLLRRLSFVWMYHLAKIGGRPLRALRRQTRNDIDLSFLSPEDPAVLVLSFSSNLFTMRRLFDNIISRNQRGSVTQTRIRTDASIGREGFPFCTYVAKDSAEAIRQLRGRKPMKIFRPIDPPRVDISYTGRCEITRVQGTYGEFPPDAPRDRSSRVRRLDMVVSHLPRSIGRYATALSVWTAVLKEFKPTKGLVLSVGVGHGAVAAAVHTLYGYHTVGIDLREAIPMVPHRDVTWIPPEVEYSGNPDLFQISSLVFSNGGNWYDHEIRKKSLINHNPDTVIIDIEDPELWNKPQDVLLDSSSILQIVRIQATLDELRYFISSFDGEVKVILLDLFIPGIRRNWIVLIRNLRLIRIHGNYLSVKIVPPRYPLSYYIRGTEETSNLRLEDLTGHFGIIPRGSNLESLKLISRKLALVREQIDRALPIYTHFEDFAEAIWWIIGKSRKIGAPEMIELVEGRFSIKIIRIISILLSNLLVDNTEDIIDLLFWYDSL